MKRYEQIFKEETEYANVVRHIPTGSKVITKLGIKNMEISILYPMSAPPMTTKGVSNIENSLIRSVDDFVKDVNTEINISKVDKEKYVFMIGRKNAIIFTYSFILYVKTQPEEKKLKKLDNALSFYKEAKYFKYEEKTLTYKQRKALPDTAFAIITADGERKYPIHDIAHARNALARVTQYGNAEEKKKVRSAVYKKYPELKRD